MRLALGNWFVLKAATWRSRYGKRRRWRRRGFVGLNLGPLAFEVHLRPTHYAKPELPSPLCRWGAP